MKRLLKSKSLSIVILLVGLLDCGKDRQRASFIRILDLDYSGKRFFFLVDPVDPFLTGELTPHDQPSWIPPPMITDLRVWRDDRNPQNNGDAIRGFAYLDPTIATSDSIGADFDLLQEPQNYNLHSNFLAEVFSVDCNQQRCWYPVIEVTDSIDGDEILAATFTATFATSQGQRVVRYGSDSLPVRAKALSIPEGEFTLFDGDFYSPEDPWSPVRRLELKNIYNLGVTSVNLDELQVSVKSVAEPNSAHFPGAGDDTTYLRGLGVDKEDRSGRPGFDHHIDRAFVDVDRGLLILPDLRPFAPGQEDSVWPPFYTDIIAVPPGRPAFFMGGNANRAIYDKRARSQVPSEDGKYFFDITLFAESGERRRLTSAVTE